MTAFKSPHPPTTTCWPRVQLPLALMVGSRQPTFTLIWILKEILFVSRTLWLKLFDFLLVLRVGRSQSSFVGGRTSEVLLFLSPASFPGITSFLSATVVLQSIVFIESAWVFGPLDVESQSAKILILKGLLSFFCAAFAIILNKSVSFLF